MVINEHNIPIDKMGVMQLYLTCQTFLVMNGLIITEGELCCENKLLAKDAGAMIEVKTPMTEKDIKIDMINKQAGTIYCQFPEVPGFVVFKEFDKADQIPQAFEIVRKKIITVEKFIKRHGAANIMQGFVNGWSF